VDYFSGFKILALKNQEIACFWRKAAKITRKITRKTLHQK
jgi:hypothetical protein